MDLQHTCMCICESAVKSVCIKYVIYVLSTVYVRATAHSVQKVINNQNNYKQKTVISVKKCISVTFLYITFLMGFLQMFQRIEISMKLCVFIPC
jgi:hypothetical protein